MKLIFLFLIILIFNLNQSFSIGQETSGLCNQLFQMADYCTSQEHGAISSYSSSRSGRVGKSGPRGPQGPPGIVNYEAINVTIGKQIADLKRYANTKLYRANTKATQNRDDIHSLKTDLRNFITKIYDIEELMTWHKMFNNRYYKVYHEKVNYQTARSNCRQRGGDLVSAGIRNPIIRSQLMPLIKTANYNLWIGLDDIIRENEFVWVDGVPLGESLWGKNQPDNFLGRQDCVTFTPAASWMWDDDSCSSIKKYMCEREA